MNDLRQFGIRELRYSLEQRRISPRNRGNSIRKQKSPLQKEQAKYFREGTNMPFKSRQPRQFDSVRYRKENLARSKSLSIESLRACHENQTKRQREQLKSKRSQSLHRNSKASQNHQQQVGVAKNESGGRERIADDMFGRHKILCEDEFQVEVRIPVRLSMQENAEVYECVKRISQRKPPEIPLFLIAELPFVNSGFCDGEIMSPAVLRNIQNQHQTILQGIDDDQKKVRQISICFSEQDQVAAVTIFQFNAVLRCPDCQAFFKTSSKILKSTKSPAVKALHCKTTCEVQMIGNFAQNLKYPNKELKIASIQQPSQHFYFTEVHAFVTCECGQVNPTYAIFDSPHDSSYSKVFLRDSYRAFCTVCCLELTIAEPYIK